MIVVMLVQLINNSNMKSKLEQLECLCSEDTLITHTIDQFELDPKSKQDKVKITNLKNLPKLQMFEFWKKKKKKKKHFTHNTPSGVAW